MSITKIAILEHLQKKYDLPVTHQVKEVNPAIGGFTMRKGDAKLISRLVGNGKLPDSLPKNDRVFLETARDIAKSDRPIIVSNKIYQGTDLDFIKAHEFNHAFNHNKSKLRHLYAARGIPGRFGLWAGGAAGLASSDSDTGKAISAGALAIPSLADAADEYTASSRAIKDMKELKYPKSILRKARRMHWNNMLKGVALSPRTTMLPITLGAGAYAINNMRQEAKPRETITKTGSEIIKQASITGVNISR